jgi:hypothetical protein
MAVPMRKDRTDENLSTADLAEAKRSTPENRPPQSLLSENEQPQPVLSERDASQPIRPEGVRAESLRTERNVEQLPKPVEQTPKQEDATPLFPNDELERLRVRWKEVQTGFVDEPRKAVEEADGLVASAMKRLAEVFAEERSKLEQQWDRGDSISTEDLRVSLQRYRTFFHRLLSV